MANLLGTDTGDDHPHEMARQHVGRLTDSRATVPGKLARWHELQEKVIERRRVFGAKLGVALCPPREASHEHLLLERRRSRRKSNNSTR